jgi:hypothetical protein
LLFLRGVLRLLVTANVPSSPILVTLMMEALSPSETSVLTSATRRHITEDGILHSHRRGNLKSYIALAGWTFWRRRNVSPVRYRLGFYIPEDGTLHSHRRENLKSYKFSPLSGINMSARVIRHQPCVSVAITRNLNLSSLCHYLIIGVKLSPYLTKHHAMKSHG